MFNRPSAFTLSAAVVIAASATHAQTLKVGSRAPSITVESWAKGEPIKEFSPHNFYIVEFWATWCGPCIAGMPHISELQEQYKDEGLIVVGVNIWDEAKNVAPFMTNGGGATRGKTGNDLMQYRVAIDKVTDQKDPRHGVMAKEWMAAAGRSGIPSAFVVDYSGNISWIGHPAQIDGAVQKLASEYRLHAPVPVPSQSTPSSSGMSYEARIKLLEKAAPLIEKTNQAIEAKQWTRAIAGANAILKLDEQFFSDWAATKVAVLAQKSPGSRDTLVYAKQLVETTYKENAPVLTAVAEALLTHESTNENARALATTAISQALLKVGKSNARVLAASAMQKRIAGAHDEAVELLTEAISVLGSAPPPDGGDEYDIAAHEKLLSSWKQRLETYRAEPPYPEGGE